MRQPKLGYIIPIELPEGPTDVTSVPVRVTPSVVVCGSTTMLDNFEMTDNKSLELPVPAAGVTVVVAALVIEFVFVVLSVVADEYGGTG